METLSWWKRPMTKILSAFAGGVVTGVAGTYAAKWVAKKILERRAAKAQLQATGT